MPNGIAIFRWEPRNPGVECRWCRQKSRFWTYIWLYYLLLILQQAGVVNSVAGGPRPPSCKYECDTSLVVSGGVDRGSIAQPLCDSTATCTKSQGNVREKILSGKSCLKLFIVSCIFASILVFAELVHFILVLDYALLHLYPHHWQ